MSIQDFLSRFTSKAGTVATEGQGPILNSFQIINGKEYEQNASPINLIKLNTGWVAIANSKNASTCASIPLKLYYKNSGGKDLQVTSYKRLSDKSLNKLCKSSNIIIKQEDTVEEIIEHPLLSLLKNINPTQNYTDFAEIVFQYQGLIGNSYVLIVKEGDIITELIPLLSEYVVPVATGKTQGRITGYIYKPEKIEYRYKPEEILHFVNYQPGNMLIGRGNLESCLSAQERYLYIDAYEKYLGLNNSRPDFAVNYKNKLNEKDMKDLYRQWNKRFGGVQNSGRVAVTSGEMEIKNLGFAPKDMQYQVARSWSMKEIAAAYGVPLSLLQTEDVNYANANAAFNQYLKLTIYPLMSKYCEKFNETIVPSYDSNLFLWFEENYTQDPKEQYANAISAFGAGVVSKNEAREMIGMEAVEEDEEVIEPVKEDDNEV